MAISPYDAAQIADDKKKLTIDECVLADETEKQIDELVKRSYDGGRKCIVSINRPPTRVLAELERRFTKAGWTFQANASEPGRTGFSIALIAPGK